MRRMLSTAATVRGSAPIRRAAARALRCRQQPRQQESLQRSAAVEDDVVEIDRVQRGSVHVLAHRIHFRGSPPSLMIAMPCFGSWVAMVPANTKFALMSGALAGSCVLGSALRRRKDGPRLRPAHQRAGCWRLRGRRWRSLAAAISRSAEQQDGYARQLHGNERRQRERYQFGAVGLQAGTAIRSCAYRACEDCAFVDVVRSCACGCIARPREEPGSVMIGLALSLLKHLFLLVKVK